MVQLKDDLKQPNNLFSFLAELCIYHTAFKSRVIGSEWNGSKQRIEDFFIVPGSLPSKNTASGGRTRNCCANK